MWRPMLYTWFMFIHMYVFDEGGMIRTSPLENNCNLKNKNYSLYHMLGKLVTMAMTSCHFGYFSSLVKAVPTTKWQFSL